MKIDKESASLYYYVILMFMSLLNIKKKNPEKKPWEHHSLGKGIPSVAHETFPQMKMQLEQILVKLFIAVDNCECLDLVSCISLYQY